MGLFTGAAQSRLFLPGIVSSQTLLVHTNIWWRLSQVSTAFTSKNRIISRVSKNCPGEWMISTLLRQKGQGRDEEGFWFSHSSVHQLNLRLHYHRSAKGKKMEGARNFVQFLPACAPSFAPLQAPLLLPVIPCLPPCCLLLWTLFLQ